MLGHDERVPRVAHPIPGWIADAAQRDPHARAGWQRATRQEKEAVCAYVTSAWTGWGRRRRLRVVLRVLAGAASVTQWIRDAGIVYGAELTGGLFGPPPL